MDDKKYLTREDFEEEVSRKLQTAVARAKEIRSKLRSLELEVSEKEKKIHEYQDILAKLKEELLKIQIKLYTGGSS
jgi:peptidoglycan hydrolase CwlO-like protein